MPALPLVIIPHPIGGIDRDEVARKADTIAEEVIEVMTMPLDKLQERAGRQP